MAGICTTTTAHPYKGVVQVVQWCKGPERTTAPPCTATPVPSGAVRFSAVLVSQNVDEARDESGDHNGKHDKLADQTVAHRNTH